jgi:hypothetical protein
VIVLDAGGADLTAITNWLIAHKPINMPRANLHIFPAQPTAITIGGTIYAPGAMLPGANPALAGAINTALANYSESLPDSGLIALFDVAWIIRGVPGVVRIEGLTLNGVSADQSIDYLHFAEFVNISDPTSMTWRASD